MRSVWSAVKFFVHLRTDSTIIVAFARLWRNVVGAKLINQSLYISTERATSSFQRSGLSRLTIVTIPFFAIVHFRRTSKTVNQGAVNLDDVRLGLVDGVFGNQGPLKLASASAKQGLEGAAHRHLVVDAELAILAERLVVALDQLVRGLEVELLLHGKAQVYIEGVANKCCSFKHRTWAKSKGRAGRFLWGRPASHPFAKTAKG